MCVCDNQFLTACIKANPLLCIIVVVIDINLHDESLQGELWGWTCFYVGVAAVAVGSSYYHLKPDDARLVWDRLPVSSFYGS